jgi:hypothetical protein
MTKLEELKAAAKAADTAWNDAWADWDAAYENADASVEAWEAYPTAVDPYAVAAKAAEEAYRDELEKQRGGKMTKLEKLKAVAVEATDAAVKVVWEAYEAPCDDAAKVAAKAAWGAYFAELEKQEGAY